MSTPAASPSSRPICNTSINGKYYHDPEILSTVGSAMGGFSGFVSGSSSFLVVAIIAGIIGATKGAKNPGTIITGVLALLLLAFTIYSFVKMSSRDESKLNPNCEGKD